MKAYTRQKEGRKTWKRAKDLDNLSILEYWTALFSARYHKAEIKFQ